MKKLYTTVCVVSLLIAIKPAAAQGGFEIGPHIGYSNFSVDAEESPETIKMSDPALGLTARYTVPVGNKDKGVFVGLEASVTHEFSSNKEAYYVYGVNVGSETLVNWSIDILPRVGYDFGKVSVESWQQGRRSCRVNGGYRYRI